MTTKISNTIFLALAICLLTNNSIFAQGLYIDANVGYNFNTSSQNLYLLDFYNSTIGNNSATDEQVNVSLGKGLNFGGTLGYMFNKNIGAELGISYLLGGKSKAHDEYDNHLTDYTLSAKMLRINPSIVIASGMENINPYAKFGLIVGSGSILYDYDDNDNGDIEYIKLKMNGGLALGLSSNIGVLFNINNLELFGELNSINLSYSPTKGKMTEATYNGSDILIDMTTKEKEIDFVDSYTYNYLSPSSDSQPHKELKYKFPFSSFGINFGIKIRL